VNLKIASKSKIRVESDNHTQSFEFLSALFGTLAPVEVFGPEEKFSRSCQSWAIGRTPTTHSTSFAGIPGLSATEENSEIATTMFPGSGLFYQIGRDTLP
jgi:hypothetical protein